MKQLLFWLITGLAGSTGNAQHNLSSRQAPAEEGNTFSNRKQKAWVASATDTTKQYDPLLLLSGGPQPDLHHLRQDNMPCLVPDPNASVSIVNFWKGKIQVPFRSQPQPIPNPARPLLGRTPSRPPLLTPLTK